MPTYTLGFNNPEFENYTDLSWTDGQPASDQTDGTVEGALYKECETEVASHLSDFVTDPQDERQFNNAVLYLYDKALNALNERGEFRFPQSKTTIFLETEG